MATTVREVVARLEQIDSGLSGADGVREFNGVYLRVTRRIADLLETGPGAFHDPVFMAELDVRFAQLWLDAFDAAAAGRDGPRAWAALFENRTRPGRLPIQYALAGMNAHIEHDLPIAVWRTCEARGLDPDSGHVRADYDAINGMLAAEEAAIRRSFLDDVGRAADDHLGPAAHLVSSWSIEKARDLAWITTRTIWELRPVRPLLQAHLAALGHTVGMASRVLLTPVAVLPA